MANNNNNRRSSLTIGERMLFLAGILFCMVLISTALLGGLYARYTTSSTGSDNARVAKFGDLILTETGDFDGTANKKGTIIPGVPLTKEATVTFTGSEMSTVVFVEVIVPKNTWKTDDNLAFSYGGLAWSIDSFWTWLTKDTYQGNTRYIYYTTLAPNTTLENKPIVKNGEISVSEEITKATIGNLRGVELSFRGSVIQSGGFDTVEEAWAAIAAK